MNEQLHRAMEEAIRVKVDAQRALKEYDEGRKPLIAALRKAMERYSKLEQCIYTGEYQPELGFGDGHGPALAEETRETVPANFYGKRQRTKGSPL